MTSCVLEACLCLEVNVGHNLCSHHLSNLVRVVQLLVNIV